MTVVEHERVDLEKLWQEDDPFCHIYDDHPVYEGRIVIAYCGAEIEAHGDFWRGERTCRSCGKVICDICYRKAGTNLTEIVNGKDVK